MRHKELSHKYKQSELVKIIQKILLGTMLGLSLQAYAEDESEQLPIISVTAQQESDPLKQHIESGALGDKSILDTPFSMTVVDSEEITKRGAKSIGQIFANDASVYTPTNSATTDWWGTQIRGLGVRNYYADDYPVLLYWGGDFPLEAADSVVALKGLTGFMYGFGSPGGAISYKLKRPKALPETVIDVGYRDKSLFSAFLDTSNKLDMADLNYRLVIGGEKGEAYNASEANRFVTSLALDKKFNDQFSWEANFVYEKNKLKDEPIQFYLNGYDVKSSFGKLPKVTYDYDNYNVNNSYYDTDTFVAAAALKWAFNDDWNAKYQFGYTRKIHKSNKTFANLLNKDGDYEGSLYNFAGALENYFNQIMVNGVFHTGKIQHDVVMGGGVLKTNERWSDFVYGDSDKNGDGIPDGDGSFTGNIYQKQNYRITRIPDFTLNPQNGGETQTYGFLSDTLNFNDQWQAILGARYTYYDLEKTYNTKEVTPTFAVIYKPLADTTIYASYVEGLEAGSRVAEPYANAGEILNATVSKQYEAGFKYDLNNLSITSALFQIERVEAIDSIRNGLKYLKQDGLTTYKGLEFSGKYKPTDDWKLGLSLIYLDASIDKVSDENKAIEGNTPSYAAKWQAVTNVEYTLPTIDGLSLHANVRYNGSSFITNINDMKVPAYTLVNAGLSYKFKLNNHDAMINGNINNLFNKKYWAAGGWGAGNMGEAINGSLTLNVKW
ncbi:TonB-dependent siderophore receptor [Acinetobacter sp.]|jgi:iron complex outermembrane receptor protein|uniref:TonB-dependent siderophore receptor n=1 Tax=Acinetobacter sp. TaxID=472 RepID=UPI00282AFA89|nr:TonB-dependent siderophore receptor [Acinetobacter sp.]MDR0237024.1 TonB-dependent siderophore receptor [Acinetobacter sp.]